MVAWKCPLSSTTCTSACDRMPAIALNSAHPGRLRPSFFLLLGAWGLVQAQQVVYRCGHEYTNAPQDASRCEPLAAQALTVIAGTKVQSPAADAASARGPSVAAPAMPPGSAGPLQKQRDEMARHVLAAELEQTRQRHLRLQEQYQQALGARTPDVGQNPGQQHQHQQHLDRLKAAVERSQRDIDSLQRELLRRPVTSITP